MNLSIEESLPLLHQCVSEALGFASWVSGSLEMPSRQCQEIAMQILTCDHCGHRRAKYKWKCGQWYAPGLQIGRKDLLGIRLATQVTPYQMIPWGCVLGWVWSWLDYSLDGGDCKATQTSGSDIDVTSDGSQTVDLSSVRNKTARCGKLVIWPWQAHIWSFMNKRYSSGGLIKIYWDNKKDTLGTSLERARSPSL